MKQSLNINLFIFCIFAVLLSGCSNSTSDVSELTKKQSSPMPTIIKVTPINTPNPTSPAEAYTYEQNRRLGRGINLGNIFEAPNEGDWGLSLEEEYFDQIKEAGFQSVRIPIRWSNHALEEAPYTIDPQFFSRIDWAIDQANKRGLAVVINIHHYDEIHVEPRPHKERFVAIWDQIALRYQDKPESLYFELLNEPQGTLAAVSWNEFASEAIQVIRRTNPERTLIIGPGDWNSINGLPGLLLPENERNIIITIHYYLPFQFTHQGAEWVDGTDAYLGTTWNGTDAEKEMIRSDFDRAAKWANRNGRPVYLGEFGAYSKADMNSRARWTEFIAREAEARGWSWAYWEFASGFGAFDPETNEWRQPLRDALLPGNQEK